MSKTPQGKPAKKFGHQKEITKTSVTTDKALYPMRINKYLALKNYSTRRGADDLITSKKVFINGVLAVLGDKIHETDTVEVKYRGKTAPKFAYFAFNKPIGMTTGIEKENTPVVAKYIDPSLGRNNVRLHIKRKEKELPKDIIASLPKELHALKLFPIGRLDKDSHGLIILTNDGRVTDRLLNPKFEHSKEYEVTTARPLRNNFKEKIEAGIHIEGYVTKPAEATRLNERRFSIVLTEGKTHQIRRMVSALFNEVSDLKRTRIMNIQLSNLPENTARAIEGKELADFLSNLGL
jgi:pseudouridine synthase